MVDHQTQSRSWFHRHRLLVLVTVNLALLIGGLFLAEFILGQSEQNFVRPPSRRWIQLRSYQPNMKRTFKPDPTYKKMRPALEDRFYTLRTDGRGFILPQGASSPADLKLAFLGGSTTACLYVDQDKRFPYLAGRLLQEQTGRSVKSQNCAQGGNNSLHSLDILLNVLISDPPNYVVMMHVWNDMQILSRKSNYFPKTGTYAPVRELTGTGKISAGVSELAKDLSYQLFPNLTYRLSIFLKHMENQALEHKSRQPSLPENWPSLLNKFQRNLRLFVRMTKAMGSRPVLMTQPSRFTPEPQGNLAQYWLPKMKGGLKDWGQWRLLHRRFNQAVRQVAQEEGALLVDLEAAIPQDQKHIYDLIHFLPAGCEAVAQRIAGELLRDIKATGKPPRPE